MKILTLAQKPDLYSHQRLKSAALARGHSFDIIPTLSCYISVETAEPKIFFKEQPIDDYDVVIPRIALSIMYYGLAVLRQFEMRGIYALNTANAIARSRDKLQSMQILTRAGIRLPPTYFAHDARVSDLLVEKAGGAPLFVKLIEDTQDVRVVLAETNGSAQSIIEAFRRANVHVLVQKGIEASDALGIRALVLGDQVLASTTRRIVNEVVGPTDKHRAGEPVTITESESEAALKAAKAVGLNLCGVDLLRCQDGPIVQAVNSSPGLEDIEKATGIDAADRIIQFLESQYSR